MKQNDPSKTTLTFENPLWVVDERREEKTLYYKKGARNLQNYTPSAKGLPTRFDRLSLVLFSFMSLRSQTLPEGK